MSSFKPRHIVATIALALAASSVMMPTVGGEAPAGAPAKAPYASKPYTVPAKASKPIKDALAAADRTPQMTERDGWRRPGEVLMLSGVKAGSRVVEFSPYGYYYSTLLSNVVGAKGEVHLYEMPHVAEQIGDAGTKFAAAHPNVKYNAGDYNKITFPRNVDLFFSVWSYHDMLLTGVDMDVFHDKMFKAMKPGAIYLVIDHAATQGTQTNDTGRLHRIDPATLRASISAAGFQMVEESRILENPQDDHKWPVHQDGKRDQTDQVVFKFRKPIVY